MNPNVDADTAEFVVPASSPDTAPSLFSQVQVDLAALSHAGRVRSNNEDHYLVVRFGRALETLMTNLPEGCMPDRFDEVGYGMVVADGMGGTAAGEVASRLAITTLVDLAVKTPDWIMGTRAPELAEVMDRMADRYRRVDDLLSEQARNDFDLAGMGTTMTLACSLGANLVLAHIGDSRAYLLRRGKLLQLTSDHTLVQSLVDEGALCQEEAATHRLRHVLTRALGGHGGAAAAEVHRVSLADDDQVLLCTDGLTNMVSDAAIEGILCSPRSTNEACRTLVELALRNGGRDNVTVVLAHFHFPSASPAATGE